MRAAELPSPGSAVVVLPAAGNQTKYPLENRV